MAVEQIDYTAWRFWVDIMQIGGLIALGIYSWWSNREKVNAKRFSRLENDVRDRVTSEALDMIEKDREKRCDGHRGRTSSIEKEIQGLSGEIQHLPNQSDIGRVHARMDEVLGQVKELTGEAKASRRQLDLVLEELLRRDKP